MPNPENFTKIQRFRLEEKLWQEFGKLAGDRGRSAELQAYVEWRLSHEHADLDKIPDEDDIHLWIWIRQQTIGGRVEVLAMPGIAGEDVDALRPLIREVVINYFKAKKASREKTSPETEPVPTKKTRRAAK